MIRVHVFEFTKADFRMIDAEERDMMLLAGHTLNHLGFWIEMVALTGQVSSDMPVVARLNNSQAHILLRSLGAVLVEAWEWLKRPSSRRLIGKKYLALMEETPRRSYAELKQEFGKSGLLYKIRNGFTSHYQSHSVLDASFHAVPEDEDFQWYVTDENTSSFYFGCAAMIDYGMIGLPGESDVNVGLRQIFRDIIVVGNAMADFLGGLLAAMVRTNFPNAPRSEMKVHGAPGQELEIPFYIENVIPSPSDKLDLAAQEPEGNVIPAPRSLNRGQGRGGDVT